VKQKTDLTRRVRKIIDLPIIMAMQPKALYNYNTRVLVSWCWYNNMFKNMLQVGEGELTQPIVVLAGDTNVISSFWISSHLLNYLK